MRQVRLFVAVFFAVLIACGSASATLMHSWDLNDQYIANRDESVGGVFTQDSGGTWHFGSIVNLGGGWGLTAAHAVDDGSPYGVYFGENVYSPDYSSSVLETYFYSDWTGSASNSHDLALVHFDDVLASVPVATIGTEQPSVGDTLHFSGYGNPGVPGAADPFDGTGRGWDGEVTSFGDPGKVPDYYITSEFGRPGDSSYYPLGGLGQPGDSGGGVFDENGLLIAIITGVNVAGANHYWFDTYAVGLWETEVQSWLNDTTGLGGVEVPLPASFWLMLTGLPFILRFRKTTA